MEIHLPVIIQPMVSSVVGLNIGKYSIFHRPDKAMLFVMVKACLPLKIILFSVLMRTLLFSYSFASVQLILIYINSQNSWFPSVCIMSLSVVKSVIFLQTYWPVVDPGGPRGPWPPWPQFFTFRIWKYVPDIGSWLKVCTLDPYLNPGSVTVDWLIRLVLYRKNRKKTDLSLDYFFISAAYSLCTFSLAPRTPGTPLLRAA